jgi:hypothetical protein
MEILLGDSSGWLWTILLMLLTVPMVEFRSLDITGTEPANRTTAGSVVSVDTPLDFGTVNNTAAAVDAGPACLVFRCTDLQGNTSISNLRFWLNNNGDFSGTTRFFSDITDTWAQNKTTAQISGGTPGIVPDSVPSANATAMGGGDITGIGHGDTSQYIYLAINVGIDEIIGAKGGVGEAFSFALKFDYA